jgi:hypothetical protein
MGNFQDLVTKLLTDPAFAQKFYNETTRAQALDSMGFKSGHPGLLDALKKINYDAISDVHQIMDPVKSVRN